MLRAMHGLGLVVDVVDDPERRPVEPASGGPNAVRRHRERDVTRVSGSVVFQPMKLALTFVDTQAAVDRPSLRRADTRYILAIGEEAATVAELDGVTVLRRLPKVALVLADAALAAVLSDGRSVHVYDTRDDALRAFSLFTLPES